MDYFDQYEAELEKRIALSSENDILKAKNSLLLDTLKALSAMLAASSILYVNENKQIVDRINTAIKEAEK